MNIIVSLTSWSKRIEQARATVDDLLAQTRKPDIIELNLDLENFPHGFMDTPKWVTEYVDKFDNFHVYFAEKDRKVYSKFVPTINRHAGEEYILITVDDDTCYPPTYIEEVETNMKGYDWLCTKDDVSTRGQEMVYGPNAVEALRNEIDDDMIQNIPLDDHLNFWILQKYKLRRGHKIKSQTSDRQAGYSFRRFFVECEDESKLQDTTCEYPYEEFVKERQYMVRRGIVK